MYICIYACMSQVTSHGLALDLYLSRSCLLSFPTPPSLLQTQKTLLTPAVAWYFPAPQSIQAVAPEIGGNFPAKHQRIISMRESCTLYVSCTGERERNRLHSACKCHQLDQRFLPCNSSTVTHTTHTRTLSMKTEGQGESG
jgi:hypothetical protein